MRNILLIGAGKSTSHLVHFLLDKAPTESLFLTIAELDPQKIIIGVRANPHCEVVQLNILDPEQRGPAIHRADLVISMLPAHLHIHVAKDCLQHEKHLVTASYITPEQRELDPMVKQKGLVFMNEVGLDPGIDHMSAMEVIDRIRAKGGNMLLFESFTGGLVAPESDNNLWNYKFTWNPRNVVLAGQGGAAKFIQEGTYKYIPYHRLFRRTEFLEIPDHGRFEVYANRDSLNYRKAYGLDKVLTLYRGTIRRIGFSRAWNMFVQLGMTDDSYTLDNSHNMSYREFTNLFLPYSPTDSVELKLRHYLKIDQDDVMWDKLLELHLFDADKKIPLDKASPAQMLQYILEQHWTLSDQDRDMIVMYHKFGYELHGEKHQIDAHMVVKGEDHLYTAMSKTVGLPVAITALAILNGTITTPGVQLPIAKEVYRPLLIALREQGIVFHERQVPYLGYNPNSVSG